MTEATHPGLRRKTRGLEVARWIQAHCVYPGGRWMGQPFRLLRWQVEYLVKLFEVEPRDVGGGESELMRRYRWSLLGLPKKAGKTSLAGALACYFAIGDGEPDALVVCAAGSEEQADLVFGAAKRICEKSPTLSSLTEGTRYDGEIIIPAAQESRIKRVAAAAGTNDGKDVHAAILDELHEWGPGKMEDVWNVITNSTGARLEPMILQITTAGHDVEGTVCGRQYRHGRAIEAALERGEEPEDRSFLFEWHEAPREHPETGEPLSHRDPLAWELANPSYGHTVRPEFYEDQLRRKTEATFRRYFLNQWVPAEDQAVPMDAWAAGARPELVSFDPERPLYAGIDLARRRDAAAVVMAQRVPLCEIEYRDDAGPIEGDRELEGDLRVRAVREIEVTIVRAKIWANPYPRDHKLHEAWRYDPAELAAYLRDLRERFPVPAAKIDGEPWDGPAFHYDPWKMDTVADDLLADGLAMIEFPQTDGRMVPASETFLELLLDRRLAHVGDAELALHVESLAEKVTSRGSRFTKRRGSSRRIDGGIAAVMATYAAQGDAPKPKRGPRLWV